MIKKYIMLLILLITLNGCSNAFLAQFTPKIVTQFEVQKVDIPDELLTPTLPPSASTLKDVKICKGAKELTAYGKGLLYCNYQNTKKIEAIRELLK